MNLVRMGCARLEKPDSWPLDIASVDLILEWPPGLDDSLDHTCSYTGCEDTVAQEPRGGEVRPTGPPTSWSSCGSLIGIAARNAWRYALR